MKDQVNIQVPVVTVTERDVRNVKIDEVCANLGTHYRTLRGFRSGK